MNLLRQEQTSRRLVVRQAVATLQARGIPPRPAMLALYEQYVQGELNRAQVTALMQQRATVLLRTMWSESRLRATPGRVIYAARCGSFSPFNQAMPVPASYLGRGRSGQLKQLRLASSLLQRG
jgi:hypothetical protein